MADKTIGSLTKATILQDDSLFVMEQQGEAMSLAGEQIREFAEDAGRESAATLKKGATFTPYLRVDGDKVMLGFNNDAGLENPDEQDVRGPAGGVNSFNGRQGAVIPLAGDYTIEQITGLADALAAVNQSLSEKAPAGYGLGVSTTYDNLISDCNLATVNGWYWTYENVANAPADYGFLFVCANGGYVKQEWWSTSGVNNYRLIRYRAADVWTPWEWVNPPMELGVEYRTTERYLGKPVYVQMRSYALPAKGSNTTIPATDYTTDSDTFIRIEAYLNYYGINLPSYNADGTARVWVSGTTNAALMNSTNGLEPVGNSTNAYVTRWYTKQ